MKAKSVKIAYLLWLPPLGWFGAHRFYLGQHWAGVRHICGAVLLAIVVSLLLQTILSVPTFDLVPFFFFAPIGLVLSVTLLWWFADGILMRGTVKTRKAESASKSSVIHKSGNVDLKKEKSLKMARLLWLPPLGWFGAHRFYLGQRCSGGIRIVFWGVILLGATLSLLLPPIILLLSPTLITMVGMILLWWLVDGFLVRDIVNSHSAESLGEPSIAQKSGSVDLKKEKSVKTAYLLWLPPFGWFGTHRLYAGKHETGWTMFGIVFLCTVSGALYGLLFEMEGGFDVPLILTLIWPGPVLAAMLVWWVIDGCRVSYFIVCHNDVVSPRIKPPHWSNRV